MFIVVMIGSLSKTVIANAVPRKGECEYAIKRTVQDISKGYGHGLGKQVTKWARSCLSCQRAKVQTHVKAPIQQFQPAAKRFDHVHIDLVRPLPESKGFKYLLTVVDRFTRWPEAIPIGPKSALPRPLDHPNIFIPTQISSLPGRS